ncbi:MAG: hypothetical protein KQH59_09255 [Desulfobulbaceae bacterium]|nr:hypothetical protein [Desulfobulbaceae bacterium]
MKRSFFLRDVIKITGIPQPTLQQWLRDGFIEPRVKADGPGTRNQFDFSNLCEILLFKRLIDSGVFREAASRQIKGMIPLSLLEPSAGIEDWSDVVVVYHKFGAGQETTYIQGEPDSIMFLINNEIKKGSYDAVSIYNLKSIVKDVEAGIAKP